MTEANNLIEIKGNSITDQTIKSAIKLIFSGKQLETHADVLNPLYRKYYLGGRVFKFKIFCRNYKAS